MQLQLGSRHTGVGQGVHGRWEMQVLAIWRTTLAWRAISLLLYQLFVGQQAKNKWMKIDVFVGNMLKYVADQSKEKALAQLHNYGTHRFLIHPEMTMLPMM